MRVLITGATGYIGRAVAQRLQRAGHDVVGMARNDIGVRTLAAADIEPVLGDLDDTSGLQEATTGVDAVIETASADHPASNTALLKAIAGTGKRFIRTSGTGIYADLAGGELGEVVHTEDDGYVPPFPPLAARYALDLGTAAAAQSGDQTVVLRPSMIYGNSGSHHVPIFLRAALQHGVSRYVGSGRNRWGNVHIDDVAAAYLLALERAPAGSVYNLAAGECDMQEIAAAVARLVGLPGAVSADTEEFSAALGLPATMGLGSNSRVDSAKARAELGVVAAGPFVARRRRRGLLPAALGLTVDQVPVNASTNRTSSAYTASRSSSCSTL